jgi:hypothetical protein
MNALHDSHCDGYIALRRYAHTRDMHATVLPAGGSPESTLTNKPCAAHGIAEAVGTKREPATAPTTGRVTEEDTRVVQSTVVDNKTRKRWEQLHSLPPGAAMRPSFVWYWPSEPMIAPVRVGEGAYVVKTTAAARYPFLRCTTMQGTNIGSIATPYAWDDEWKAFVTVVVRRRPSDGCCMLCTYTHPSEDAGIGTMRVVRQTYVFGPNGGEHPPAFFAVALRLEST